MLGTQHLEVRAKIGLLWTCPSGAKCLSVDCCFSEL